MMQMNIYFWENESIVYVPNPYRDPDKRDPKLIERVPTSRMRHFTPHGSMPNGSIQAGDAGFLKETPYYAADSEVWTSFFLILTSWKVLYFWMTLIICDFTMQGSVIFSKWNVPATLLS